MKDHVDQTNTDPGTAIVLWKEPDPSEDQEPSGGMRREIVRALMWSVVGGMATVFSQVFGPAMVGYGFAYARGFCKKEVSWLGFVLAALVGATLGAWYDGVTLTGYLVGYVGVLASAAVSRFVVAGKGTITRAYVVAVLAAVAIATVDFVPLAIQGVTPTTAVSEIYTLVVSQVESQLSLDSVAALYQYKDLVMLLWPLGYALVGFAITIGAHLGSRIAVIGRMKEKVEPWKFSDFKAPRWSVVVLALCASLVALSYGTSDWVKQLCLMVGLNGLFLVRFIFTLQGVGVLTWFMRVKNMGCLFRFMLVFLAFDLEVSFFALSIVGLIDVWANFRGASKNGVQLPPPPTT